MTGSSLEKAILDQLDRLAPEEQMEVLAYARALAQPIGIPGQEMLHFAGLIPPADLEEMERAIEEGCEQIDSDGW